MAKRRWHRVITMLLAGVCGCLCSCGTPSAAVTEEVPTVMHLPYLEQTYAQLHLPAVQEPVVATWLPYFLYPELFGSGTEEQARAAVREILSPAAAMGINTVFAHALAFGEAYYRSDYYPLAEGIGAVDYLQILSEECDALGLSLHAWLNPLRLQTPAVMDAWSRQGILTEWYGDPSRRAAYMVQVGERYYLNPACREVHMLLCNAARELLTTYAIDGIHIDDYFYPTTEASFDAAAFAASGATDLATWRRGNINHLLKELYTAVHSVRQDAVFSVSPGGNLQADLQSQYADCALWCSSQGYCDWLIPQLYYGYENQTMPFAETLAQWLALPRDASVRMLVGLAAYKVGAVDAFAGTGSEEWQQNQGLLARQMQQVTALGTQYGAALYHLESLLSMPKAEQIVLQQEIFTFFSDSFYPSAVS